MTLNTRTIISATERMLTLAKRDCRSNDDGQLRSEIKDRFLTLCTELGKIAMRLPEGPDWAAAYASIDDLHTAACHALEAGIDDWQQAGSVAVLSGQLAGTAAVLGFTIADASTARIDTTPEDESARRYAEGHETREAAE